ncbi:MAG: sensor domain-containing protein [Anaerolineales bacterium]|nr:sensor domain-containing protein [Anaerolineales bacterium]MBK9782160.1 sensor domain-containing protein [Anaerolineales bacterium]
MFNTIEEYLDALKNEMKDADPALVQDAQADAREHLTLALKASKEKEPDLSDVDALTRIIDGYGSPEETASAYREVERRTSPTLGQPVRQRSFLSRFFGVYTDPRAWGALLYMLIAFVTGVFYFTWAVTGVSVSVSFLIFIFGFPFALLFLISIRGLALLEGRLVEALLGVRMPRRPLFSHQGMKWFERLKALVTDRQTWLMILYMLIQFVLGTIYFVLIVTVLSFSVSLIAIPFVQESFHMDMVVFNNERLALPTWTYPLWVLGGFLLWTIFMNIVRGVGQLHGKLAKWILVGE